MQHSVPDIKNQVILVDSNNNCIGFGEKIACHQNDGLLHRAFSVLIFNTRGELLLQKRSTSKMLWPEHWSNSCCSHPFRGESDLEAAERRTMEELSLQCKLYPVYQFEYHARYKNIGAEHELCSVLIGVCDEKPHPCPKEVAEICYLSPEEIDLLIVKKPESLTPWFKLEWQTLREQYWKTIQELVITKVAC